MGTLVWDQIGDRTYEAGVSKGVFYKEDRFGVAWNGLVTVQEDSTSEVEELYYDGVKYADVVTSKSFSGTISAFTYPDELMDYEGNIEDQTGLYITGQRPKKFSLAYRTEIGDDVSGFNGYKIHILYNLSSVPTERNNQTLSDSSNPILFEWNITSIPEPIFGYQPTAHVIINSLKTDPFMLRDIEDILYGDADENAYLPSLQSLATFIRKWQRLIIVDNGDGTWTATSSLDGVITMLDAITFEITEDSAVFIDADSYTIESSQKNEEDLWLP
jgi:hypothetical protein